MVATTKETLTTLVDRAGHILKLADDLRYALDAHGDGSHLDLARSYLQSIRLLAGHVSASLVCEQRERDARQEADRG